MSRETSTDAAVTCRCVAGVQRCPAATSAHASSSMAALVDGLDLIVGVAELIAARGEVLSPTLGVVQCHGSLLPEVGNGHAVLGALAASGVGVYQIGEVHARGRFFAIP
jgi:hypothetical protein